MIEEQIEELDALINLYKNDPVDGLRNKIWEWYKEKTAKQIEEAENETAKYVKRYRQHLGLSQEEFGKIYGVSHASISDLETGKTSYIQVDIARDIIKYLTQQSLDKGDTDGK